MAIGVLDYFFLWTLQRQLNLLLGAIRPFFRFITVTLVCWERYSMFSTIAKSLRMPFLEVWESHGELHNRKLSGHHHCSLWSCWAQAGFWLPEKWRVSQATSDRGCSQCFRKEHLWLGFIASGPNHFCHEFWDLSSGWVCLSETDGCSNRIRSCIT